MRYPVTSTGASPFFSAEIRSEIVAVARSVVTYFARVRIGSGIVDESVKRSVAAREHDFTIGGDVFKHVGITFAVAENDAFEFVVG